MRPARSRVPGGRGASGFTLLEMAIVLPLVAGAFFAMLMLWLSESQKAQARLAGQQYRALQEAAADYLALFGSSLLTLPKACGQVSFAAGTARAEPAELTGGQCRLALNAVGSARTPVTVYNALQPTVDELKALGLVDASFRNRLLMRTQWVVVRPGPSGTSNVLLEPGFGIVINRVCAADACPDDRLTALVYNTQPYAYQRVSSWMSTDELIGDAWLAAGPDAALSAPIPQGGNGELQGWRNSFEVRNPLREYRDDGSSIGLAGVLAVRIGYGSASQAQFARLDGSREVSGPWNFNGHDVLGVKTFKTQNVEAARISAAALKADKLALPVAQTGQACEGQMESLALSKEADLLICRGNLWSPAQPTGPTGP